jgi:hypothetical protein
VIKYLRIDQHIKFIVDNGVKALFFEILDGILAVIIIAPAEENEAEVFGNVHLTDVSKKVFGVGDNAEKLKRRKL